MNFNDIANIAYLGPTASFSEMARDIFCEKYGINTFSTSLKTIQDVVEFVDKNPYTLGVIPVENSIEGSLRASFDSLMNTPNSNVTILSEVVQPIEYCLLSKTTEFYSITGIIGVPYLLGRCQEFIKNEMPLNLNIVERATIEECAKSLDNYNLTYGIIGNRKIAELCRLNILKEHINDDKTNRTRYVLIGSVETPVTGNDKTTLAFAVDDKPGNLLNVLKIFLENDINLTYISSRPSKDDLNQYVFTINFNGHYKEEKISKVLEQIKPHTTFCRVLGSYETLKN